MRSPAAHVRATLAITRWNLRLVGRAKLFWLLVAMGLIHFVFHFVLIYVKAQVSVQSPGMSRFMEQYLVTGQGTAYRDFLTAQSIGMVMLLAYAGVVLVTADFRAGGVLFYLARPIGRWHYIAGKWLALTIMCGLLTLLPALVLFLAYGLFLNDSNYWIENPRIAVGIVGYGLLMMSVPSLLLLALGVVCRKPVTLVMTWCIVFLLLPALSELLREVFRERDWRLLNLFRSLRMLGEACFGTLSYDTEVPYLGWAASIVMGVTIMSLVSLRMRLQPLEIIE